MYEVSKNDSTNTPNESFRDFRLTSSWAYSGRKLKFCDSELEDVPIVDCSFISISNGGGSITCNKSNVLQTTDSKVDRWYHRHNDSNTKQTVKFNVVVAVGELKKTGRVVQKKNTGSSTLPSIWTEQTESTCCCMLIPAHLFAVTVRLRGTSYENKKENSL